MFEAKEKVEAEVAKLGIPWETDDYVPLPEWKACIDHEVEEEGFDMFPVYWTNAINTDTWQVENAWINEINEMDDTTYLLEINDAHGRRKGHRSPVTRCACPTAKASHG